MTKKPTTDDGFDRATLREAANHLQENLKAARKRGRTVLNVMEAAASSGQSTATPT